MGGPKIEQQTIEPKWFDPLGPNKNDEHQPNGGPEYRKNIFASMSAMKPTVNQSRNKLVSTLNSFGNYTNSNVYGQIHDLGKETVAGKFLNGGPALDSAIGKMRSASGREAATSEALARSAAARSGVAYSTGAQEAQDSVTTAARAQADQTEGNMRQAVYMDERNKQVSTGPALVREAGTIPVDFLSQVSNAVYGPAAKEAQVVQGLAGGGTYMTPEVMMRQKPGGLDYATQILSSL